MTRYEQGFLTKCAEYGLDTGVAVQLMKGAAESRDHGEGALYGLKAGLGAGGGLGALFGGSMMVNEANKILKNPASGTRGMNASKANKFVKMVMKANKTRLGRLGLRAKSALPGALILGTLGAGAAGIGGAALGGLIGRKRED